MRTVSLPDYYCDSSKAYKISSNQSLHFEYFSNNISPKNKLTPNLCACEVPKFFIKKQKVSGTLPPAPAIQLNTLCSTTTTQTGATGFTSGNHVYFVKGPSPTAGDPHHVAGNTGVGFTDKLDRHLSTCKFLFLMPSSLFYCGLD